MASLGMIAWLGAGKIMLASLQMSLCVRDGACLEGCVTARVAAAGSAGFECLVRDLVLWRKEGGLGLALI